MRYARVLALWIVATPSIGTFCLANPLDEHRRASRSDAAPAYVLVTAIHSADPSGRITLDVASSALIRAGLLSGDPVAIHVGPRTLLAYAAFRDEIQRSRDYALESGEPLAEGPGLALIVDREAPADRVVLDAAAGGVDWRELTVRQPVRLHSLRRVPSGSR